MKLVKYLDATGLTSVGELDQSGKLRRLRTTREDRPTLTTLLALDDDAWTHEVQGAGQPVELVGSVRLLAPIDDHEVWGAGVTYLRSKVAREEESEGAARFYDLVYQADRPELFFKATPHRVVGPGEAIRVRSDSRWTVPEPELGLVLTSDLRLAGVTLGDDVSARDIEGANPLYLPQAKVYSGCCAIGPCVRRTEAGLDLKALVIRLMIRRGNRTIFESDTPFSRMVRPVEDLIGWLGRDNSFPNGAVLLTGTGIVPPDDLSIEAGDVVEISCDEIGTLTNPVIRGS